MAVEFEVTDPFWVTNDRGFLVIGSVGCGEGRMRDYIKGKSMGKKTRWVVFVTTLIMTVRGTLIMIARNLHTDRARNSTGSRNSSLVLMWKTRYIHFLFFTSNNLAATRPKRINKYFNLTFFFSCTSYFLHSHFLPQSNQREVRSSKLFSVILLQHKLILEKLFDCGCILAAHNFLSFLAPVRLCGCARRGERRKSKRRNGKTRKSKLPAEGEERRGETARRKMKKRRMEGRRRRYIKGNDRYWSICR